MIQTHAFIAIDKSIKTSQATELWLTINFTRFFNWFLVWVSLTRRQLKNQAKFIVSHNSIVWDVLIDLSLALKVWGSKLLSLPAPHWACLLYTSAYMSEILGRLALV